MGKILLTTEELRWELAPRLDRVEEAMRSGYQRRIEELTELRSLLRIGLAARQEAGELSQRIADIQAARSQPDRQTVTLRESVQNYRERWLTADKALQEHDAKRREAVAELMAMTKRYEKAAAELEAIKADAATSFPFLEALAELSYEYDDRTIDCEDHSDPFREHEHAQKHGVLASTLAKIAVEDELAQFPCDELELAYHAVLALAYRRQEDTEDFTEDSPDAEEAELQICETTEAAS